MPISMVHPSSQVPGNAVQQELARILVRNARTAQITAIGVGTIAALLVAMMHRKEVILAWWLTLTGVSLVRLFFLQVWQDTRVANGQRDLLFAMGLAISGLTWGALPFATGIPGAYDLAVQFIIIGGIGAGATTSLAPSRSLFLVFMIPALGGLLLALAWYQPPYAGFLAATIALYLLAMSTLHRNQHRMLHDMVETRLRLQTSLSDLDRNQKDRLSLARQLEENSGWVSRYLAIANDVALEFEPKSQRLMNLLRELLSADGVAFCQSSEKQLVAIQRMNRKGRILENETRCHINAIEGIDPEDGPRIRHFPSLGNPASRLFGDEMKAAIILPLAARGQVCGALVIGYRHDAPAGLRPTQRELLNLTGSWLTMELFRQSAMKRLHENREAISRVANSIPGLIAFVDSRLHYRYVNEKLADAYMRPATDIIGKPVASMVTPSTYKLLQPFIRGALQGIPQEFELEAMDPEDPVAGGKVMKVCYTPSRRIDGSVDGFYVLAVDITNDVEERRRLHDKSSRDPLTGLRNRTWFLEQVRHEASSWEPGQTYHLLIMDVDGFKAVNDEFGHLHGDRVLRQVADILRTTTGEDDMLVRIGGDEFLLVLRNGSRQQAEDLAADLIERINKLDLEIRGARVHLGLSVGIARIDRRFGFKAAYRRADEALYSSKQRGRNRYTVHYE